MNQINSHAHCCWIPLLCFVIWWFISSGLLLLTWNRVISTMTKVKTAKYWQALLLVATISVFCAPKALKHRYCHQKNHCATCCNHDCGGDGKDGKKEDCAYGKHSHESQ